MILSECETSITEIITNNFTPPLKDEPLRVCRVCGLKAHTITDLNLFTKDKNHLHGRRPCCKNCQKKLSQKYRQEHLEERKKKARKYREKHKEETKKYNKKYRDEHKEEIREKARKFRQRHPEIMKKHDKKHRKKHRIKYIIHTFLYHQTKTGKRGYLEGAGCCLWPDCYEINPWMLNQHHPWKKIDPEFTVTLCENHHALFTRRIPAFLEFNFNLEDDSSEI